MSTVVYDEELAGRLRERIHSEHGVSEKRMFGGLAFWQPGSEREQPGWLAASD